MNGRVRKLLALVLALLLCPASLALAVEPDTQVAVDSSTELERISHQLEELSGTVSSGNEDILVYLRERDALADAQRTADEVASENDVSEVDVLERIDDRLLELVGNTSGNAELTMAPYDRASTITVTAYGNTSPTSQYANYARGMVPKIGWSDHYVFLQDGASSYVMAWGDLELADSQTITGTCDYVRWYFVSQAAGYQIERGSGFLSVTTRGYTVLTDLGDYPLLSDASIEQFRREVMLYAIVAVCVFSLHSVWRYLLRNRARFAD